MTRPDVSVVIATRERWPWLERTLAALAQQRVEGLKVEVVVADALSADGSWESLESFAAAAGTFPFGLAAVQAAGFGGAAARNMALGAATGHLVLFLADDARPASPTWIAGHVAAHGDARSPVAVSGGLAWADGDDGLGARLARRGAVGDDRGWLAGPPPLRIENCSVPREALLAVDGFDERLTGWNVEGIELSWRLDAAGVRLRQTEDLLALRAALPDPAKWLREVEETGRHVDLLDRLHPRRRTPGPRGVVAVCARAVHPLARHRPGSALARRCALARGRGRAALPAVSERRGGVRALATAGPRPGVSVVIPFYGDREALRRLLAAVGRLRVGAADEVIVADNTPEFLSAGEPAQAPVRLVHAHAEQSAPHARNAGAEASGCEWVLFMDADCLPAPGLIDAFFSPPPADDTGAVAGAVLDPVAQPGLTARYSASRERLGQAALLAHPYMSAAVTANLLVRRRTWEELGGLCEGIRSEEDLDFCWRMQRAGWALEHRAGAAVEHRHRETLRGLLAQAQRFGRGFAWQDRRYPGSRITGHLLSRLPRLTATALWGLLTLRAERATFALLDVAVAAAEVAGRLRGGVGVAGAAGDGARADLVLVADAYGDVWNAPLVRDAHALRDSGTAVRVEALARGWWLDRGATRGLGVAFAEDDGAIPRGAAVAALVLRHPLRCLAHGRPLGQIAPVARRVRRSGARHLHASGGGRAAEFAAGLADLTGLPFSVHVDGAAELAGHEAALGRAAFLTAPSRDGAAALRAALRPEVGVVCHAVTAPERSPRPAGTDGLLAVVGRLDDCAGVQEVVSAVAMLRARGRSVRLLVLGEGNCRRAVAEAAEAPGIRQPEEVLEMLAGADALVVPVAAPEVAEWPPAAVQEARACGCAVVGPLSGAERLAAAIEDLLGGPPDDPGPTSPGADPGHVAAELMALVDAAAAARR